MTEDRNSKIEIRAIEIIWRNREEKLWKNRASGTCGTISKCLVYV